MEKISENKEDLEFIRGFAKIKISNACKYFGYDQSNLMKGRSGRRSERNVRKYIEKEIAWLRINEMRDDKCQK